MSRTSTPRLLLAFALAALTCCGGAAVQASSRKRRSGDADGDDAALYADVREPRAFRGRIERERWHDGELRFPMYAGDVDWKRMAQQRHSRWGAAAKQGEQSLTCQALALAWTFAKKIQPWRGEHVQVFDALQLGTLCGLPRPGGKRHAAETEYDRPPPRRAASALHADDAPRVGVDAPRLRVVVDADADADAAAADGVHASVENALEHVRALRAADAARGAPRRCSDMVLRAGVHYLNATLLLTPDDDCLTVRSAHGERGWLSGGRVLGADGSGGASPWQRAGAAEGFGDPALNVWYRNDAADDGRVDGLNTLWPLRRLVRARFPNVESPETTTAGWLDGELALNWTSPPPPRTKPRQVFINLTDCANVQPCKNNSAQWQYNFYSNGYDGHCELWTPAESYWCSKPYSYGGWAEMDWAGPLVPVGMRYNQSADDLAPFAKWSNVSDGPGIVHAFRYYTWFVNMFEMASHNASSAYIKFLRGGYQGGRGWHMLNVSAPKPSDRQLVGGRFYVENVREELDAPGEWFYSRHERRLYLWPNNTRAGEPPPSDDAQPLVVPTLHELVRFVGSQAQPVRDVHFVGIGFRDAAYTYMQPHGVPSGGDWALQRTAALTLEGAERTLVRDCMFVRLDGNALLLSGYNRNTRIERNEFAWIGDSAMAGWGYTNENDGTNGDQPRLTTIDGNFAHDVGIWEKQSSMWFQARTCQTNLTNNIFFNGPRAAINFNDGFGGGNTVNANLIFSQCRESGDHGPINSWDRMQFVTRVRDGTPSYDPAISEVAYNFGIGDYGASQWHDTDDGSSFYYIHDNFFYDADLTKMDYGGHDSTVARNVVVVRQYDRQNCYNYDWPFLIGRGHTVLDNRCVVPFTNRLGHVVCEPDAVDGSIHAVLSGNRYYTKNATGVVECIGEQRSAWLPLATLQRNGYELGSTLAALPDTASIVGWAKTVLNM